MDLEETFAREGLKSPTMYRRMLAYMIDDLLISLIIVVSLWESLALQGNDPEAMIAVINSAVLEVIALKFAYHWIFTALYGASLGKMLLKIRVISIDTLDNPSFLHAASRAIFRVLSEILFYIPMLVALIDPHARTLHDRFSRTVVISLA